MKRKLILFLIFAILFLIPLNVKAAPKPPAVLADGAILIDADTGDILFGKNIDAAFPPASVTKIMTALLTLENCSLDDEVIIDSKSPLEDGSKIYIFEGEKIKVSDLLYGLLLSSGNDCAGALATHIAGSQEAFAKMMNERAKELGAKNTNFVNPCGLYNANHKTSAYDLSLIMKQLIKYNDYLKIAKTLSYKIEPTNKQSIARPLWNENRLIQQYDSKFYKYALAGKTGYTTESKFSYIAYAKNGERNLITVLLHENTKAYYDEAKALFEYGFNNFEKIKFFSKGDVISKINIKGEDFPLAADSDYYYIREKGKTDLPNIKLLEKDLEDTSFIKGENILSASIVYNGKEIGEVSLSSIKDHKTAIAAKVIKSTYSISKKVLLITLCIILGAFLLLLTIRFYNRRGKRRKKSKYMK